MSGHSAIEASEGDRRGSWPRVSSPISPAPDRLSASGSMAADRIGERAAQGEYILGSEVPFIRKWQQEDLERVVKRQRDRLNERYSEVFSSLGVDPEVEDQLKQHISAIGKARFKADLQLQEYKVAKLDFDRRMQDVLGEEGYDQYRGLEARRPAERNVEEMSRFLEETVGVEVEVEVRERLEELVFESGLAVGIHADEVYGPGPVVAVGVDENTEYLSSLRNAWELQYELLDGRLNGGDFSQELIKGLRQFYAEKDERLLRQLEEVANGPRVPEHPDPHAAVLAAEQLKRQNGQGP